MIFLLSLCLCYILINQFIKWDSPLEKLNYRKVKVKNSGGIIIALTSLFISYMNLMINFNDDTLYLTLGISTIVFVGLLDDVFGDSNQKGFKGHLLSLTNLIITTGLIKAVVGFLVATSISLLRGGSLVKIATDILLVSFSINLINLLDLRPGRACKFFLIISAVAMTYNFLCGNYNLIITFSSVTAATVVFFSYDARELVMLGDAGANVLGLCLGLFLAWSVPLEYKIPITALFIFINLAAERYSFSLFIEQRPVINLLDSLGRKRPLK